MDTKDIEKQAEETDMEYPYMYYVMGVAGEAGEVVELHKKAARSGTIDHFTGDREELAKEIGDQVWYLARLANLNGYTLEECWELTMKKIKIRQENGYYGKS